MTILRATAISAAAALLAALAAYAVFGLAPTRLRIPIDPSSESLLPRGDPARTAYREARAVFGDDQVYVVALEVVAPGEDVFGLDHLRAIRRLTRAFARLGGVRSVTSLADVIDFRWDAAKQWVDVGPFLEDIPTTSSERAALRARALANPLFAGSLIAADARTTSINVRFAPMSDRAFIESGLDAEIAALVDAERSDSRRLYIAGRPHAKARVFEAMMSDLRRLIPTSFAAIAAMLWILGRAGRVVWIPLATVACATLGCFGALAASGHALNVLTVLLAPTLIAIGSAYSVHIVYALARPPRAPDGGDPIAAAMRGLRLPIALSAGTTALGFAALTWTDVPAVFELGAFSVFGVACIAAMSLWVVPAWLALSRAGPAPRAATTPRWLDRALASAAELAIRHPGPVLVAWGAAAAIAAVALPRIVIDTDYLSFFSEHAEVRRDFAAVNRLLAGATPLYVVLDAKGPGAFREPEALQAATDLQRSLAAVERVSHTRSLADPLARLHRAFAEDDPQAERIPDTHAGISELIFSIPKRDLGRLADIDQRRLNLVLRTGEVGSAAVRALVERIEERLARLPASIDAHVTGNVVLLARSADAIARTQPRTFGFAALAIFALVTLGLRSPALGVAAMAPNLVPVLLFFGALGLGAAPLSLPTSLIASIALGLAVDETAHYLVAYRAARAEGDAREDAVRRCSTTVGRPIAVSALTLTVGFATIALSNFAPLVHFGVLAAGVMLACLLADLLLLPAILVRMRIG